MNFSLLTIKLTSQTWTWYVLGKIIGPDLVRSGRTCPANFGVRSCPGWTLKCPVRLRPTGWFRACPTLDSILSCRQKSTVYTMHVALPKRPINQFNLIQQSRQQALRAFYPNIYTVAMRKKKGLPGVKVCTTYKRKKKVGQ